MMIVDAQVHIWGADTPAEDREWIMGRGICEWLGWPL
jgi:hypothetical protein